MKLKPVTFLWIRLALEMTVSLLKPNYIFMLQRADQCTESNYQDKHSQPDRKENGRQQQAAHYNYKDELISDIPECSHCHCASFSRNRGLDAGFCPVLLVLLKTRCTPQNENSYSNSEYSTLCPISPSSPHSR